jgi:hypothetical protein
LIELRCGAKDIEIPDLTTYKWNRKNETKENKMQEKNPQKTEKRRK